MARIAQGNTTTGAIAFPAAAARSPLEVSRNLLHHRAKEAPAMSARESRITRRTVSPGGNRPGKPPAHAGPAAGEPGSHPAEAWNGMASADLDHAGGIGQPGLPDRPGPAARDGAGRRSGPRWAGSRSPKRRAPEAASAGIPCRYGRAARREHRRAPRPLRPLDQSRRHGYFTRSDGEGQGERAHIRLYWNEPFGSGQSRRPA